MASKLVLVVDDAYEVVQMLEQMLVRAKYSVIKAYNGEDALALAKTKHPDLVLLDIMMPGMDGGEVAARLKNDPETEGIPVVFLTCLVSSKEGSKEIGGQLYIGKPFDMEKLLSHIKKII